MALKPSVRSKIQLEGSAIKREKCNKMKRGICNKTSRRKCNKTRKKLAKRKKGNQKTKMK